MGNISCTLLRASYVALWLFVLFRSFSKLWAAPVVLHTYISYLGPARVAILQSRSIVASSIFDTNGAESHEGDEGHEGCPLDEGREGGPINKSHEVEGDEGHEVHESGPINERDEEAAMKAMKSSMKSVEDPGLG